MKEGNLINTALENFQRRTGIKTKWEGEKLPEKIDGILDFTYDGKKHKAIIEAKSEIRGHQLPALIELRDKYETVVVIAEYIFPKIKEQLRELGIGYIEKNGNTFYKKANIFLWLEDQKTATPEKDKTGRAFTKTGLKLVFHFLLEEPLVNLTYRQLAERTKIGFGNINFIMTDLKEQGFLLQVNKDRFKLNRKKQLLEKWMVGYEQKLKPALVIDTFRFLNQDDFIHWQKLKLRQGHTFWGGEPAAQKLTNYLRPGELTMYTLEKRMELTKNYKLVPGENGNVKVFQKFWNNNENDKQIAPPLLVYVDLMLTGDRRCIETAEKIYNEYLQNQF